MYENPIMLFKNWKAAQEKERRWLSLTPYGGSPSSLALGKVVKHGSPHVLERGLKNSAFFQKGTI